MSGGQILHLCNWDRKFTLPFRDLIHRHFADGRHRFLVYGDVKTADIPPSPDTVVLPGILDNFSEIAGALRQAEKIILHGLFHNHLLYLLATQPRALRRCYWMIWGGDLYVHELPRTWRLIKDDWFRRFVIRRIGHFVTYVEGDYDLARRWYGASGRFHECILYPSNAFQRVSGETVRSSGPNIQIGNSADPGNNHMEIFERLKPFRDQAFTLYAPLSYGNQEHARRVAAAGREMFGDKFVAMTEFMDPEKYRQFLDQIDIAVFAHRRQQGMGNAIQLLGLGRKVYLRSDVSSWRLFQKLDLEVFDFEDLDLTPLRADIAKANEARIAAYFSEDNLRSQLAAIFAA